ncbi:unnamed protein product [Urochloa decumbens]|uniref:Secreted protein n=1 Tax=Urochloa decumbens TaxID=240449 RepID=A0ABC8YXB3_9POAL
MTTKRCSSFLPCMYATAIALAVFVSCSGVVDCSEVKDDAAAQPDGGRDGWAPPSPQPGTVHHRCPDLEPECAHPGAPPPPPPASHRKIGRSW